MASLNSIVRFLNKELRVGSIKDKSHNGLQVRVPKEIKIVGFAVDASLATFKKAKKAKVDLLIVHHGIIWKGVRDIAGLKKKRINYLKRHKMNLYGCHLPLDIHKKLGNNILIARLLGLKNIKPFGKYEGRALSFRGSFGKTTTTKRIKAILDKALGTNCAVLPFGRSKIKTVGLVSGRGLFALPEAAKEKLDCFITGEMHHESSNAARDLTQNVILAGHYKSETIGIKALMPLLKDKFGVRTVFIDAPTGF